MKKYITVFSLDWQNQFTYRLNFILWRLRNILRVLMTYFLWKSVFPSDGHFFGFSQGQIIAYVFLVLFVQSLVLSAPSGDNVGGEIGSGQLSNYLVKPISYLKFWFVRDISSKILNTACSLIEIGVLYLLFRPNLSVSITPPAVIGFTIACLLAIFAYYFLSLLTRLVSFWSPENTWGLSFMVIIFIETLAGMIFPLDLLPTWGQTLVQFTPFPYLIYYPISILVGRISELAMLRVLVQSFIWVLIMFALTRYIWTRGLRVYGSEGR